MRISRKTVLIAASLIVLGGITVVTGAVLAVVKFIPVARTWTTIALSGKDVSLGESLVQLAGRLNSVELKTLIERGVDPATLAAASTRKEFATLLGAVANYPALGAAIRDGAYREAMAEALRQKAPTISQIQLDQVATPQAREAVQRVQGLLSEIGPAASKIAAVDAQILALLETPEFAKLLQDAKFVDFLIRPNAGKVMD